MDKKLISLKTYLNEGTTHLNFTQFKSLLENLKGNKQPMSTILNYTKNLPALAKFIEEDVYPKVGNSGIKRRCTSILKSYPSYEVKLTTTLEAVVVTILINNKSITICNVYLSNKYKLGDEILNKLIQQIPKP